MDTRLRSIQCFTGNTLKIIACFSMLIDHFAKITLEHYMYSTDFIERVPEDVFYKLQEFKRIYLFEVGTIAFPLFCLLLSEGFVHTRNRKRYILGMLLFALISEMPFDLGFFHRYAISEGTYPFYFKYQNVFFTLFLGLIALWGIEKIATIIDGGDKKRAFLSLLCQFCVIALISVIAEFIKCDYGSKGIIYVCGFYLLRKSRLLQSFGFIIMYLATTGNQPPFCTIIAAIIILLYNGERGKMTINKYLFYWYYPVHISLLYGSTFFLK